MLHPINILSLGCLLSAFLHLFGGMVSMWSRFHILLAIYHVTINVPDVECGGGFYVRSLVSDIGKGGYEEIKKVMVLRSNVSAYRKLLPLFLVSSHQT